MNRAKGLIARFKTLRMRHRQLDEEVKRETAKPAPDTLLLQRLKRLRLRAKEDMEAMAGVVRLLEPELVKRAA